MLSAIGDNRVVGEVVTARNTGNTATIVGTPRQCNRFDGPLCQGTAYTRDGLNAAAVSAGLLAASLRAGASLLAATRCGRQSTCHMDGKSVLLLRAVFP
jgi:hypothetical protein